ncbi:MAG TPA: hypothetical protein VK988_03650 [Acidimicrobiales bacterium]|nr:hypothetical protein [Acidimicrobiales bacterium]
MLAPLLWRPCPPELRAHRLQVVPRPVTCRVGGTSELHDRTDEDDEAEPPPRRAPTTSAAASRPT